MNHKANNYSNAVRAIALATAFTFSSTNLALAGPPVVPRVVEALGIYLNPPIDLSSIKVPADIGKIQEVYGVKGQETGDTRQEEQQKRHQSAPRPVSRSPFVVLIQDAHAIPEAQRNIQKLIQHFQNQYGISTVGVEGAATDLDAQIFNSFPDKQLLEKTFEEYFERGELNGTAAAAVLSIKNLSRNQTIFHGVENWNLYEKGLALYLEAVEKEPKILEGLQAASYRLQGEKEKIYSKELLEIDQALEAFKENQTDLVTVLKILQTRGQSPAGAVPLSIQAILDELAQEGADSSAIEREVRGIAERVKEHLLQATGRKPQDYEDPAAWSLKLAAFNQSYQEFQTSRISPEEFALYLKELLNAGAAPTIKISDRLQHLLKNQKRLRDIEGTQFFRDFETYAKSVKESLFRNNEERKLDAESRRVELLEKLAKLELSREDWEEIKTRDYRPETSDQRQTGIQDDSLWAAHFAFYKNAENRDQAFFGNLLKLMAQPKPLVFNPRSQVSSPALLVAGGFHTQGLARQFKEKGISYVIVQPQINQLPISTNYRAQMQGEVSWKDYFEVEQGKVNLYKAFVRGARDRLLRGQETRDKGQEIAFPVSPVSRPLLKAWRDQIIRDLADQNRLEKAHDYTQFLDEIIQDSRPKTQDAFRNSWSTNIDRFITGLHNLESHGRLTEQNILKLLNPATIPTITTASFFPNTWMGARKSDGKIILSPRLERPPFGRMKPRAEVPAARSELRSKDGQIQKLQGVYKKLENAKAGEKAEIGEMSEFVNLKAGYFQKSFPLPNGNRLGERHWLGSGENLTSVSLVVEKRKAGRLYYVFSYEKEEGGKGTVEHYWDQDKQDLIQGVKLEFERNLQILKLQDAYKRREKAKVGAGEEIGDVSKLVNLKKGSFKLSFLLPNGKSLGEQRRLGSGENLTSVSLVVEKRKAGRLYYVFSYEKEEGGKGTVEHYWDRAKQDLIQGVKLESERDPQILKLQDAYKRIEKAKAGKREEIGDIAGLVTLKEGKFQKSFLLPNGNRLAEPRRLGSGENLTSVSLVVEKRKDGRLYYVFSYEKEEGRKGTVEHYWDAVKERLVRIGEEIDAGDAIDKYDFTEAVALLGNDPLRLVQYLRIYHPELSPEETDRSAAASLRGLRGEGVETEELHLDYEERLAEPEVTQDVQATHAHSFLLSGRTTIGTPFIQVTGAYTRKIAVRQDGSFSAPIPLPRTGETNEFTVYAFDPESGEKSPVVFIQVDQTGQKEDAEEAFLRLLSLKEEKLESIQQNPARYEFLLRSVEQSLLKHFTYDEKAGLRYLEEKIGKEKSKAQKAILEAVLKKFRKIKDMDFNLKAGERLYFFQKYTAYEIQSLMTKGAKGLIVANEQGTGKTVIALMVMNGKEGVILTPNSVVSTWAEQEDKFIPQANLEVLEGSYAEREERLTNLKRPQLVTNIEFTRAMNEKKAALLSRPQGLLVVDEADYLGSKTSQQAKGTRQIQADFKLLLTATPFKRISQIGELLQFIRPDDSRFSSARAFARAFPAEDREAMNALFLLMQEHTIRIRKRDVFETYDPAVSLEKQSDRLPAKEKISPEETGKFDLHKVQMESILELFTDPETWMRKHKGGHESVEDTQYYRYREGYFSKREALRQLMNDPAYIGRPDLESPKHLEMDEIVNDELVRQPGQKMLIFTRYRAQVEEYKKRYAASYGVRTYYGDLPQNANGYKVDENGNVLYYKVDEYKNPVLENGKLVETDKEHGRPVRALDYERILFQNDPDSRIMVATYDAGAVGVTFTAADVVVFDDLAQTYRDEYQAEDRAHRIDNKRKKYKVKYYWLQARYPESFLRNLPKDIREQYFNMGTFDQVQYENLRILARIFHRVMDGVGSEEELGEANQHFMSQRMPFMFSQGEAEDETPDDEAKEEKSKTSSRSEIRSERHVSDTAEHSETGRFGERQESQTFVVQGSQEPDRSEVRTNARENEGFQGYVLNYSGQNFVVSRQQVRKIWNAAQNSLDAIYSRFDASERPGRENFERFFQILWEASPRVLDPREGEAIPSSVSQFAREIGVGGLPIAVLDPVRVFEQGLEDKRQEKLQTLQELLAIDTIYLIYDRAGALAGFVIYAFVNGGAPKPVVQQKIVSEKKPGTGTREPGIKPQAVWQGLFDLIGQHGQWRRESGKTVLAHDLLLIREGYLKAGWSRDHPWKSLLEDTSVTALLEGLFKRIHPKNVPGSRSRVLIFREGLDAEGLRQTLIYLFEELSSPPAILTEKETFSFQRWNPVSFQRHGNEMAEPNQPTERNFIVNALVELGLTKELKSGSIVYEAAPVRKKTESVNEGQEKSKIVRIPSLYDVRFLNAAIRGYQGKDLAKQRQDIVLHLNQILSEPGALQRTERKRGEWYPLLSREVGQGGRASYRLFLYPFHERTLVIVGFFHKDKLEKGKAGYRYLQGVKKSIESRQFQNELALPQEGQNYLRDELKIQIIRRAEIRNAEEVITEVKKWLAEESKELGEAEVYQLIQAAVASLLVEAQGVDAGTGTAPVTRGINLRMIVKAREIIGKELGFDPSNPSQLSEDSKQQIRVLDKELKLPALLDKRLVELQSILGKLLAQKHLGLPNLMGQIRKLVRWFKPLSFPDQKDLKPDLQEMLYEILDEMAHQTLSEMIQARLAEQELSSGEIKEPMKTGDILLDKGTGTVYLAESSDQAARWNPLGISKFSEVLTVEEAKTKNIKLVSAAPTARAELRLARQEPSTAQDVRPSASRSELRSEWEGSPLYLEILDQELRIHPLDVVERVDGVSLSEDEKTLVEDRLRPIMAKAKSLGDEEMVAFLKALNLESQIKKAELGDDLYGVESHSGKIYLNVLLLEAAQKANDLLSNALVSDASSEDLRRYYEGVLHYLDETLIHEFQHEIDFAAGHFSFDLQNPKVRDEMERSAIIKTAAYFNGVVITDQKTRFAAIYRYPFSDGSIASVGYTTKRSMLQPTEKDFSKEREITNPPFKYYEVLLKILNTHFRSEVRQDRNLADTAAEVFVRRLTGKPVSLSNLKKAAHTTVLLKVEPVTQRLEAFREKLEGESNSASLEVLKAQTQQMIDVVRSKKETLNGGAFAYFISNDSVREEDWATNFERALRHLSGLVEEVIVPAKLDRSAKQRISDVVKKFEGIKPSVKDLTQEPIFMGDHTHSGVVVSGVKNPQDFLNQLDPAYIPIVNIDVPAGEDPLISEFVLLAQMTIALLVADYVRDDAAKAKVLQNPALLFEQYPDLFPGFQDRVVQGEGGYLKISNTVVREFLAEMTARAEIRKSA